MQEKTFQLLSNGHTVGVFQLESKGMQSALRGLKPDRFEDIIAVVSLYRPGPMENIPSYINRKHGKEKIEYMHPNLKSILEEISLECSERRSFSSSSSSSSSLSLTTLTSFHKLLFS